jgi:outer membrane lipoprotein-sorting protein
LIPLLLVILAADPLPGVLAKMDAVSATFKGAKADIKRVTHNAAVDINSEFSGTMVLKRPAPHDVRTLVHFTKPDEQQVYVGDGVADLYYPKINTIQERKIGKYQSLFEQFYLLAFGGSGKDLVANYDVTYVGSEAINAEATSHLQLIPKSADVKKNFTKIELWLTEAKAIPSQLRLSQPSGDTTTFVYTNVIMNPKISDSDLKLKTKPGVKTEYPAQ